MRLLMLSIVIMSGGYVLGSQLASYQEPEHIETPKSILLNRTFNLPPEAAKIEPVEPEVEVESIPADVRPDAPMRKAEALAPTIINKGAIEKKPVKKKRKKTRKVRPPSIYWQW